MHASSWRRRWLREGQILWHSHERSSISINTSIMSAFPSLFSFGSSSAEKQKRQASAAATARLQQQVAQLRLENQQLKASQEEKPVFSFGVIADIQYADIDDAHNFAKTELRRYRHALSESEKAVSAWNAYDKAPLAFIAQLGDIIDGQNAGKYGQGVGLKEPVSFAALETVLERLEKVDKKVPYVHCVGNHELYNFTWEQMEQHLNVQGRHKVSEEGRFYFSFRPALGWTVLVLNPYEVSTIQDENLEGYKMARAILERENPNDVFSQGKGNYFQGLKGDKCRFVPFNGGVGEEQLEWLRGQVQASKERKDKLIVLCHVPLHHKSASWKTVGKPCCIYFLCTG